MEEPTPMYRACSSVSLCTTKREGLGFLTFLAAIESLRIDILPFTWQRYLQAFQSGGTSELHEKQLSIKESLAFKCVGSRYKGPREEEEAFTVFGDEVTILGNHAVRDHPNIIKLLGICWDIESQQTIWPVLMFERSKYGSLSLFAKSSAGSQLDIDARIKICVDIGNAIKYMHGKHIIHGDIKPDNVLIFKEHEDSYVARVADFGYSTICAEPEELIALGQTLMWHAPEITTSRQRISLLEAKSADVFSFSMLCAWLLFYHQFSRTAHTSFDHVYTELHNLRYHENTSQLFEFVNQCLHSEVSISDDQKEEWRTFFLSGLSHNPQQRSFDNTRLFGGPHYDVQPDLTTGWGEPSPALPDLRNMVGGFYLCDYRVRQKVFESLIENYSTIQASKSSDSPNQTPNMEVDEYERKLKFMIAFCYFLGFGVKKSQDKVHDFLRDTDFTEQDFLEEEVTASEPKPSADHEYFTKLTNLGLARADFGLPDTFVHEDGSVKITAQLEQDLLALEQCGLDQSLAWLIVAKDLFKLYWSDQSWNKVQKILPKCIEMSTNRLGEDHEQTLDFLGDMGVLLRKQGNLAAAGAQVEAVLQKSLRIFGKDHGLSVELSANLASIYREQGAISHLEKAAKLEKGILKFRDKSQGGEHEDTQTARHQLAETYKDLACAYHACACQEEHGNRSAKLFNDSTKYFDECERLQLQVIEIGEKQMGHCHPQVLTSRAALAGTYVLRFQYDEAEKQYQKVLDARKVVNGHEHPKTLLVKENLATCLRHLGRMEEAEKLSQDVVLAYTKCAPEEGDSAMQQCVEIWQSEWRGSKFSFDDSDNEDEWATDREMMMGFYFQARPDFQRLFFEALSTYQELMRSSEL